MFEILCECNADIPGVDSLPHHVHRQRVVMRQGNRVVDMLTGVGSVAFDSTWDVVYVEDVVVFSIDWKQVARELLPRMSERYIEVVDGFGKVRRAYYMEEVKSGTGSQDHR